MTTWTYILCPHCGHTSAYPGPAKPDTPYYCLRCALGCIIHPHPASDGAEEKREAA